MKHLYVHIPFCRSRCGYCDFVSEPVGPHARAGRVERYLDALRVELADRVAGSSDLAGVPGASGVARAAGVPGARVPGTTTAGPDQRDPRLDIFETIYVGGGTPTVLPEDGLVTLVRELSGFLGGPRAELTVEANPGTIDCRLLERLARAGATRLSLGVQSFAPALRAALGRRVAQKEIEDALGAIAETGWCEWNIDLVFGIPGQTWDDAVADLETVVAAGPSHISLYDLAYTAAFSAHVDMTRGTGAGPAAVVWAEEHYAGAVARLEGAGYGRYEVSNFALPGHECRHNQAYWRGEDYLGIGAAAVSTAGGERWTNPRSVEDYLAGSAARIEVLSPRTRLWEKAMLGLRTSEGVDETEVMPVLTASARDRLLSQGCLERHCGKLRLNPGFLDISNAVISALLVSPEESHLTQAPAGDGTHRATKNDS